MATLLRPGEWQGATAQDAIERQFDRLRSGDDRLNDIDLIIPSIPGSAG